MADALASLPVSGWLLLMILAATLPVMAFIALAIAAFVPGGAGRAGWRDHLVLPRRRGTASWRELHPAWTGLTARSPSPPWSPPAAWLAVAAAAAAAGRAGVRRAGVLLRAWMRRLRARAAENRRAAGRGGPQKGSPSAPAGSGTIW